MAKRLGSLLLLVLAACAAGDEESEVSTEQASTAGDRRDPANAKGDRTPGTAELFGRKIVLHISDADNAAWASIDNGNPNDEVWLDRSFDGGATWQGRVGKAKIPSTGRSWRTLMYSVDDVANHGVGVLRACGKAGDREDVKCTGWHRSTVNAGTRVDAAATALMGQYNVGDAIFREISWWNSANAMTSMIDYMLQTDSQYYRYAIAKTFEANKNGGNIIDTVRGRHDFTNEFLDDTGWWGLAWIRAYDLTHESRYLEMAIKDADYMWSYHDDKCGGGVWWKIERKYKNAITNELFIKLSASIYARTRELKWRTRAEDTWKWFKDTGMINGSKLINDGLNMDTCKNNGDVVWTYNQGVILGALTELSSATGDKTLLEEARELADASIKDPTLNPGGILREPCESNSDVCGVDGPSFKGAYARNLGELDRALKGRPYQAYLKRQADSAYAKARNSIDQYGIHWAGPFDKFDGSRQHSALDLLLAAK